MKCLLSRPNLSTKPLLYDPDLFYLTPELTVPWVPVQKRCPDDGCLDTKEVTRLWIDRRLSQCFPELVMSCLYVLRGL